MTAQGWDPVSGRLPAASSWRSLWLRLAPRDRCSAALSGLEAREHGPSGRGLPPTLRRGTAECRRGSGGSRLSAGDPPWSSTSHGPGSCRAFHDGGGGASGPGTGTGDLQGRHCDLHPGGVGIPEPGSEGPVPEGCPVPKPELPYLLVPGKKLWTVKRRLSQSTTSGDRGRTKTTDPAASQSGSSEGCLPRRSLFQEGSGVSILGKARKPGGPSEKLRGHLRTGAVPQKKTLLGKMNPECGDLGMGDSLCSKDLQDRVSTGDVPHEGESCGSREDPLFHRGKNSYTCKECGKGFVKNRFFLRHQQTHTGVKHYTCKKCGKTFLKKVDLVEHRSIHIREKLYECIKCGKAFRRKSHLTEHQRIHSGEKPFGCTECGKAFIRKSHLTEHKRSHSGEKPYVCSECGKAFAHQSDFIRHQRTHTGEKPFECKECGKAFGDSSSVTRHMRCHSREKPYECSECGKTYSYSSTLSTHQKVHSGVKAYKCKRCGKAFYKKEGLRQHQRTHTGDTPF